MNRLSFLKSIPFLSSAPMFINWGHHPKQSSVIEVISKHISWEEFNEMMDKVDEYHPGYFFKGCAIHNFLEHSLYVCERPIFFKKSKFENCRIEFGHSNTRIMIESSDTHFYKCYFGHQESVPFNWNGNGSTIFNCIESGCIYYKK